MASSVLDDLKGIAKDLGRAFGQAFKEGSEPAPEPASAHAPEIHIDMGNTRPAGLVALTCPKCNASIQVPADRGTCYCSYCGSQLLIDDGSATVTYRTVDEARIRELETKSELELRKLEIEERRRPGKIKATIVLALIGAFLLIGGNFFAHASGDLHSPWYMASLMGYFPLLAIAFIWLPFNNNKND